MLTVRKAVLPVAGLGTRFLPATRSVPKMMLPVVDTPALQYVVEEAVTAGIEHIVLVISEGQEAVKSHFDHIPYLEAMLEQRGELEQLNKMKAIPEMARFSYVTQKEQLGFGHAVLMAKSLIGDEPFAVMLPDDIIWNEPPTIGEMADLSASQGGPVIAVEQVTEAAIPSLGIIDPVPLDDRVYEVAGMVEKPALEDAPSDLAITGRYILTPDVFEALERTPPGAKSEIQLTDALALMLQESKVYAYRFPGDHFDVGTPLGLLKASIYAALQRDELSEDLRGWLRSQQG